MRFLGMLSDAMADSDSGLKTVLTGAIGAAIITGLVTLLTSTNNQKIEQEKLALERQRSDAETALHREAEAHRLKEAWQTRMDIHRQAVKAEQAKDSNYWKIFVKNDCNSGGRASIALYYLALDDHWVNRGWLKIESGEKTAIYGANTRNRLMYYFGHNDTFKWSGEGKFASGSHAADIPVTAHYFMQGDPQPDVKLVRRSFRQVQGRYDSENPLKLTCDSGSSEK
jgi:hypothetical protein